MRKKRTTRYRTNIRRESKRILPTNVSSPLIVWNVFLRKLAWLGKTACAALVLLALVWASVKGINKVLIDGERFRLTEVNIVPEPTRECFLTYSTVPIVTGIEPGESIFTYSLPELTKTLNELPEVLSASVDRRFPGTLTLHIEEREPVARIIHEDQRYLVDASGYLFQSPRCLPSLWNRLPRLTPSTSESFFDPATSYITDHGLKRSIALVQTFSVNQFDYPIQNIEQQDAYSLLVTFETGAEARFGFHEHERQTSDLRSIFEHAKTKGRHIRSVNLLPFKNIPVVFHDHSTDQPAPPKKKTIPSTKDDIQLILEQG